MSCQSNHSKICVWNLVQVKMKKMRMPNSKMQNANNDKCEMQNAKCND